MTKVVGREITEVESEGDDEEEDKDHKKAWHYQINDLPETIRRLDF